MLLTGKAYSQKVIRVNTFTYNVNEGLLQSHVNDIAFDEFNFAWLSFENGIQKFDGANFIDVPVQKGLPDDKNVKFFNDSSGKLFISHEQGVSVYNAYNNTLKEILKFSKSDNYSPDFIGIYKGVLYLASQPGLIYALNLNDYKSTRFTLPSWPKESKILHGNIFSGKILDGKTIAKIANNLILIDLINKTIPGIFSNAGDKYFLPNDENLKAQYLVTNGKIISHKEYDFNTKFEKEIKIINSDLLPLRAAIFSGREKKYYSFFNRLYAKTNSSDEFEYVTLQNKPICGNDIIFKISKDRFGNIYLLTLNSGIRIIFPNQYNLKYFGVEEPKKSFVTSLCIDKKSNRVLVGTYGNGLLIFDTTQKLIQHILTLPNEKIPFSLSAILKLSLDEYVMMPFGKLSGYVFNVNTGSIKTIPFNPPLKKDNAISYYGNKIKNKKGKDWVQIGENVFSITQNELRYFNVPLKGGIGGNFYNNYFIQFYDNHLQFYDSVGDIKKRFFIPNTGGTRCIKTDGNFIYLGSNKGIFKIDSLGNILYHLTKNDGLPDECIYAMHLEDNGDLWCSTNKGIFKLTASHQILQVSKEDGLQENEFNTNVVEEAEDGELYFGGVNGVSSFYPKNIFEQNEKTGIIFTRIKVNNKIFEADSAAAWSVNKLILNHTENSIAFDFMARLNGNPSHLLYQYKMLGVDDEWIPSKGLETVRYFLQPGNYKFQVYASRLYNPNAIPMAEITLIISPPFWKTWWFISALSLAFLAIVYFIIRGYYRKKYRKKLLALEQENKMQLERNKISKDLHDSIGAYANVVLYKTELLQKEKEAAKSVSIVNDLKYASRDIITSLRENIWALKQDSFTAEECLLRMKNFILNISRYYPDIQFKILGEAPDKQQLHYQNALHAVRIVQEAITNAVKHSQATKVILNSETINKSWILTVVDNGQGFKQTGWSEDNEAYGLDNMRHRATEAKFDLKVTSLPGEGTNITINISTI